MKRLLLATCLATITFVGCSSETISKVVAPSVDTISADQLKQLVDGKQEFVLLDVRETDEIEEKGTLPNYLHIPVGQVESRMSEVPKGKLIIAACERGGRAGRAAAELKAAGYDNVKSFGFVEYRAKNYPLIYPKLNESPQPTK